MEPSKIIPIIHLVEEEYAHIRCDEDAWPESAGQRGKRGLDQPVVGIEYSDDFPGRQTVECDEGEDGGYEEKVRPRLGGWGDA
jgi:hypothetical protein